MVQMQTYLKVADNTGAKELMCIRVDVYKRRRHAGSNGSVSSPSRVFKGKKLPGHLGAERVTIQNLTVVKIDAENNLIAIKGAVPGAKGSVVTIHDSVKA